MGESVLVAVLHPPPLASLALAAFHTLHCQPIVTSLVPPLGTVEKTQGYMP